MNTLNWLAREEGSGYFKREWTPVKNSYELFANDPVIKRVRAWDLAATLPSESYPNPDYTAGVLIAKTKSGKYIIEDVVHGRWRAGELDAMLVEQTRKDFEMYGASYSGHLPIETGAAGKIVQRAYARMFAEAKVPVKFFKVSSKKSKLERFLPFASAAETELVEVLEGDWNDTYFHELEAFTGSRSKVHDDLVDATSDAYNLLSSSKELPIIKAGRLRMR